MNTAPGANETGRIIMDNECREYREGWNANNSGAHYLSNPYSSLAFDGELYRLWQKGFDENQKVWDYHAEDPEAYSKDEIEQSFTITDPKNHNF